MSHDQFCPATLGRYVSGTGFTPNECRCELIATVRDDQRGFDIRQQVEERDAFRAKVQALRDRIDDWEFQAAIDRVLALIDGGESDSTGQ